MRRRYGQGVKSLLRKKPVAGRVALIQFCASCILILTAMPRIYLLGILLLLAACSKDAPEAGLPPATQTGANTGGCLVNGERFVATGWGGSLLSNSIPSLSGGFFYDSLYYLHINGVYKGQNTTLTLFCRSQKPGSYLLNQNTVTVDQGGIGTRVRNHAAFSVDNNAGAYVTDARYTGQITLSSASRASGVSSGTFEFTAVNQSDPTKTVTVTSGRFDRKQ